MQHFWRLGRIISGKDRALDSAVRLLRLCDIRPSVTSSACLLSLAAFNAVRLSQEAVSTVRLHQMNTDFVSCGNYIAMYRVSLGTAWHYNRM